MLKALYKILIVEDEKIMQNVLADRLSELKKPQFQVFTANNGQEGLEIALQAMPDLILADIKMPVMDRLAMMKEIQKHDQIKNIPIIFLTNYDTSEDTLQTISGTKTCFYIIKSTTHLEELVNKIKDCLKIGAE